MSLLIKVALWLYPRLLRLYPRRFREEFAEEMTAVFQQQMQATGDWRDILAALGRELRDWPLNCLREHLRERNRRLLEPQRPFLSGWGAAAAATPFLLSFFALTFPILPIWGLVGFLVAGVLLAWLQRWPGWVASWLGFLILFGQSWFSISLLGEEAAWNSMPRLLVMLASVAIQVGWLAAMYGVVHRWPRYGALVFLPFLWTPWAFSMEFASEALTTLVYAAVLLILALTAAAISRQRSAGGDVWLLYGGALLPGALITLGAVLFSPGMETAWGRFAPNLMQALAPVAAILLLHSLTAWSREKGRAARRCTRLMAGGAALAFGAFRALDRLVGPSDLEAFQLSVGPALAAIGLLGLFLVLGGGWGLHRRVASLGKRHLAIIVMMLALPPLLYRSPFLSDTVRGMIYDRPSLSEWRRIVPALQTADTVLFNLGVLGLFLSPLAIARLRRETAAFPATAAPAGPIAWLRRRKERREGSRRKRAALWAVLALLLAGGVFFGAVFLPLQLEAEPYTQEVALGDVDGDGDLDAVLANTRRHIPTADNKILYNDGHGRFRRAGRTLGQGATGVALLDGDGDGDLDILIGGMGGGREYRNQGDDHFRLNNLDVLELPESGASEYHFGTGDLNGDGVTDVFVAGCCGTGLTPAPGETEWAAPVNRVLLGGDAGLEDSGQQIGVRGSRAVALGDVDGDGDLDAFVGNTQSNEEQVRNDEPNEVWLNDGAGAFSDSGQLLGERRTYAVALGDVDGDGDLDALVGNEGADELWLNDGDGRFVPSHQSWSGRRTLSVFLADLDGDGDLDAVTGHQVAASFAWRRQGIVWWNEGNGRFNRGEVRIRYRPNAALAVGDVDGDGRPDIISGALDEVEVWFNQGDGRFR